MIAGVTIAFHMHKDVFPSVLMLLHHCYPTLMLKYPVVVDRHPYLCILYKIYCEHAHYFDDGGSEK